MRCQAEFGLSSATLSATRLPHCGSRPSGADVLWSARSISSWIAKINERRRAGARSAAVLLDDRLAAVRDFEARLDAEVGAGDVAFAPEEREGVGLPIAEAQIVEHDLAGHFIVGA